MSRPTVWRSFDSLRKNLAIDGIDCVVAAGMPRGTQASRGDAVIPTWLMPIHQKSLAIRGRSLNLGIEPTPWLNADAVILGLKGSSLTVYQALNQRRHAELAVGLWGHIRPYVSRGNKLDLALEHQQMKFADHVFSYTPGGKKYAVNNGIEAEKITIVMNSIDTIALENARRGLNSETLLSFTQELGVNPNKTVCFIGGLDESKRIHFLAEALDHIWQLDKSVRLLIGGSGPEKAALQKAMDRGQAVDLGYLDIEKKAIVMAVSKYVVMPGRIGLIAVDSLVMQRPIITTDWPYHAPEVEYLKEGQSLITVAGGPIEYARAVLDRLDVQIAVDRFTFPDLQQMTTNFSSGVRTLLKQE